jgi:hypothetical protein
MRAPARIAFVAGFTFASVVLALFLAGPVAVYDAEEHLFALAFGGVILLGLLSIAAGDGHGLAAAGEGLAALVGWLSRRLRRGATRALAGIAIGLVLGLAVGLLAMHSLPMRLAYARARPRQALLADYLAVLPVIDSVRSRSGMPPRDLAALSAALAEAGTPLSFSTLEGGVWTDAWGRPFAYRVVAGPLGIGHHPRVHSLGANGLDEDGGGDDVPMESALLRWEKRAVQGLKKWLVDGILGRRSR